MRMPPVVEASFLTVTQLAVVVDVGMRQQKQQRPDVPSLNCVVVVVVAAPVVEGSTAQKAVEEHCWPQTASADSMLRPECLCQWLRQLPTTNSNGAVVVALAVVVQQQRIGRRPLASLVVVRRGVPPLLMPMTVRPFFVAVRPNWRPRSGPRLCCCWWRQQWPAIAMLIADDWQQIVATIVVVVVPMPTVFDCAWKMQRTMGLLQLNVAVVGQAIVVVVRCCRC